MVNLNIKPLSVNQVWQGKRFKTKLYGQYERDLLSMLPNMKLPKPPYKLYYEFGFSNSASDIDNPIKPFQDVLQKKYDFNDSLIHHLEVKKVKVKKGFEYIKFEITTND
jgi:Holliday junction resolvase RusA-like endonuclease